MPNHLTNETSPYLLQHVNNPVDWYPWGEEALALAYELDKPILLSIGYAACHWCHVMAHESFEDEETAGLMNQSFVNIKVDREERPDLDSIYMSAVQSLTGQGGWPMTVFLTPQGKPFYGGTYFPPVPRYGMPSFQQLLTSIADTWQVRRQDIEDSAGKIALHLSQSALPASESSPLQESLFDRAIDDIRSKFDAQEGGFGQAPKFPPSMTLEFLLRMHLARGDRSALDMAEFTLIKMAHGGMYDQLGGGFARYATDDKWLIPHFEKMLYDNALLSRVYLHAYQVTGNPLYRRIVEETLDFVVRELRHEAGGFYSSFDADSEGEEGKFYVWHSAEVRQLLGADADLFMHYYDVTENGNWEGHSILNVKADPQEVAVKFGLEPEEMDLGLQAARQKLYEARAQRVWPGLDDKVLTAWNGLMLASFAEAGRILQRPDYTQIAKENAQFLYAQMRQTDGRLLRTWKAGFDAKYNAYLEDYAYLADGLLALYQTTFETRWFLWVQELAEQMLTRFGDKSNGGFFDTSSDHESLIYRPKDVQDNATPSANAMAAHVLLKLSMLTGNGDQWDIAQRTVSALADLMARFPTGFSHWLCAAAFILGEPQEVAIAGDLDDPATQRLINAVYARYRPNLVIAAGDKVSEIPLLVDRPMLDGESAAYVCRRFVCHTPVTDSEALVQQLN
ncbi:MAG: DUF255 domain-containing protein [Chloroflexi bacterium]|jgi:uncharacterized protein YyaL (SSP411 family)|nr:DUF255 domain-containing protein [Chloroflexota bacterium]